MYRLRKNFRRMGGKDILWVYLCFILLDLCYLKKFCIVFDFFTLYSYSSHIIISKKSLQRGPVGLHGKTDSRFYWALHTPNRYSSLFIMFFFTFFWFEYSWSMEICTSRRYDLVGVGVPVLEEMHHCGGGL